MKTVTSISVDMPIVTCPHCNDNVDLTGDPRGTEVKCTECDGTFRIADDAELTL